MSMYTYVSRFYERKVGKWLVRRRVLMGWEEPWAEDVEEQMCTEIRKAGFGKNTKKFKK